MKLGRRENQDETKSPASGVLKNIVHTEKFGIVSFDNIGVTGRHYHIKLEEVYLILSGEIIVEVKEKGENICRRVELKRGDVLLLQPGDVHKIIETSKENKLLVFCIPDWQEEDEIIVDEKRST